MAVYSNMVITNQGLNLYSKVQAGAALNFTRMQIGGGQLGTGQDPATLTALITPIAYFAINSITSSTNTAHVKGIFENTSITVSTYSCEIGLFATDPDLGEILYAYANAGTNGDTIPPISAGPLSKQYQINAAIGNAASVTATIPAGTFIPQSDKGVANGVAPLDANSHVPIVNLPQIDHTTLSNIGTKTHAQIDSFIASVGAANGIAPLDANSRVPAANLPVIPIANGGTGSATQNFVDLTTAQTIGGAKVFSSKLTTSLGALGTTAGNTLEIKDDIGTVSNALHLITRLRRTAAGADFTTAAIDLLRKTDGTDQQYLSFGPNGVITTPNNMLDDGAGGASFNGAGQTTAAFNPAGALGGTIYAHDTGAVGGNGGAVLFGAAQGAWAVIKSLLENGTGPMGSLVISLRKNQSDTTLTESTRFNSDGSVIMAGPLTINGSGGSFANSKAGSGYQKLPGGLILQWGTANVTRGVGTNINFPIVFSSACYSVVPSSATSGDTVPVPVVDTAHWATNISGTGTATIYYLAIGF